MNKFNEFMNDESGATAIEYGLIAAATGLALVAVTPALSAAIQNIFNNLSTAIDPATAGGGAGGTTGG